MRSTMKATMTDLNHSIESSLLRIPDTQSSADESEDHFCTKLYLARRADDGGNRSGIARTDGGVRQIELRRVEQVEAFDAKLEPRALRDVELFEEREVEVH